jgi:hypothetical protein
VYYHGTAGFQETCNVFGRNVVVECVAFLLHILEVPASNVGPESIYSCVSPVTTWKLQVMTLKEATIALFHVLPKLSFRRRIIRRYRSITYTMWTVSLNDQSRFTLMLFLFPSSSPTSLFITLSVNAPCLPYVSGHTICLSVSYKSQAEQLHYCQIKEGRTRNRPLEAHSLEVEEEVDTFIFLYKINPLKPSGYYMYHMI